MSMKFKAKCDKQNSCHDSELNQGNDKVISHCFFHDAIRDSMSMPVRLNDSSKGGYYMGNIDLCPALNTTCTFSAEQQGTVAIA
jgi:hypothetical protein